MNMCLIMTNVCGPYLCKFPEVEDPAPLSPTPDPALLELEGPPRPARCARRPPRPPPFTLGFKIRMKVKRRRKLNDFDIVNDWKFLAFN